jgi:hypothetical protein
MHWLMQSDLKEKWLKVLNVIQEKFKILKRVISGGQYCELYLKNSDEEENEDFDPDLIHPDSYFQAL